MLKFILAFILIVTWLSIGRSAVQVNYIKLTNFTSSESVKIHKTAKVIEQVLNSEEFKQKVLNHTYEGKKQFFGTTMTNMQVYEAVMRGAEKFYNPVANGNIDISLSSYYSWKRTIGYTYETSDTIWLNRKFHNGFTEFEQPSNIVHEWTHKLGFSHSPKWNKARDFSAPYGIGSIVEELCKVLKAKPHGLNLVK